MNILESLASRKSVGPRSAWFVAKGALALSTKGAEVQSVDTGRAMATAIITSAKQDREDDIVDPAGIILADYEKNPVVMWDHGQAGEGGSVEAQMPVGLSEHDERLCVYLHDDYAAADCYFHQKTRLSAQVCAGVMDGWIRGASVSFKPVEGFKIPGTKAHHFKRVNLLEWSWAAVPVNADAVSRAMSLGKIAGSPIEPVLMKSFRPYVIPAKYFRSGWDVIAKSISRPAIVARDYKRGISHARMVAVAAQYKSLASLQRSSLLTGANRVCKSLGMNETTGPDGGMAVQPEVKAMDETTTSQEQMKAGMAYLKALKDVMDAGGPLQEHAEVLKMHEKMCDLHKAHCMKAYPELAKEFGYAEEKKAEEAEEKSADKPAEEVAKSDTDKEVEDREKAEPEPELDKAVDDEPADEIEEDEAEDDEDDELLVKSLSDRLYRMTGERI